MSDDGCRLQPLEAFLEARFVGEFSSELFNRQLTRAIFEAVKVKCRRLLVDATPLTGTISLVDRYEIALHGAEVAAGFRVSILANLAQMEPRKFGVLVAVNRSLEVDIFRDRGAALLWLFRDALPDIP